MISVAVSDKDPLKRGASFECRLVKGNAGRTLRYEQWPPDISEYLRSQGFGPRELATPEVADSAAIAGQLSFELNIPRSEELAKAVEALVTAAKKEDSILQRTGGVLASNLAWTQLSGTTSAPARPWLVLQPELSQEKARPPPGEKIKKLLVDGEERAARELRLFSGHANLERSWPLWGRPWSRR